MSNYVRRPLPPDFPFPKQETERLLIERLQSSKSEEDYFRWLLFVVAFYRGIKKTAAARALANLFIETSNDPEHKAHCHLALGQIATDEQHLDKALNHFSIALGFEPKKAKVAYVLHNNMGYCLNHLGRFEEAEAHCRLAVAIDSRRASAYRNLGISLEGQGHLVSAAWAWVESIKVDRSDDRSRCLLKKLMTARPSILLRCPWIDEAINSSNPTDDESLCT
ncbi:MAG TPA: tetratricopeptide repeat protein [Terriglobales bacterium]|nr:tetratricopeptide repeat protein [Terriglobales bacterium]